MDNFVGSEILIDDVDDRKIRHSSIWDKIECFLRILRTHQYEMYRLFACDTRQLILIYKLQIGK